MKDIKILYKHVEEKIYPKSNYSQRSNFSYENIHMNDNEKKYFLEVIHELYNQGIIAWGRIDEDIDRFSFPNYIITSYGKAVLESEEMIPHDAIGYIKNIEEQVPQISKMILRYLDEIVQCFIHNNLFASSVMLGAASEITFNKLFDSFVSFYEGTNKPSIKNIKNNSSIKRRFDYLKNEVEMMKKDFPSSITEALVFNFDGIFNIIRIQRNEIGHPSEKTIEITKEQMFGYLQLFVPYCKTLYDLIDYFENHKQINL